MNRSFTSAANPFMELVDVDGVARQFRTEPVVDDIDMNAVADSLDMNRLMSRVDWNQVLYQANSQALADRMNVNELMEQSSMAAIVAKATAGYATDVLDAVRSFAMVGDAYLASWMPRRASHMPPTYFDGPEETKRNRNPPKDDPKLPAERMEKAVAMQGCYSGFVSKTLAIVLDTIFLLTSFLMFHMVWAYAQKLVLGWFMNMVVAAGSNLAGAFMGYGAYWFLYYLLSTWLIGKTLGMHIVGLEIVIDRRTASRAAFPYDGISFWRSYFRTLSMLFSPCLLIFFFWRRDGRMAHDWIAGTGVVYNWDADMAHYRHDAKATKRMTTMKSKKRGLMAPLLNNNGGFDEP